MLWSTDDMVLADESCNLVPVTKLASNDGLQNASSLFKKRGQYILLIMQSEHYNSAELPLGDSTQSQ